MTDECMSRGCHAPATIAYAGRPRCEVHAQRERDREAARQRQLRARQTSTRRTVTATRYTDETVRLVVRAWLRATPSERSSIVGKTPELHRALVALAKEYHAS